MIYIFITIVTLFICLWAAKTVEEKGYSPIFGFILGVFWPGIIIVFLLPNKIEKQIRDNPFSKNNDDNSSTSTHSFKSKLTKKCPACNKRISIYATECPECRALI